ncbi:MAG TPA: alpha/beta hydrolase [Polyangiaceae bacterium]|nr:alpha/beta hydrolase [Polyangiaceae bacterium]
MRTPPFLDGRGDEVNGSIAEAGYARLGGVDQFVMMRGLNRSNPPLILLHGGPGFSETAFFRFYCAPLERFFTLIYWDQRGAGKSARSDVKPETLTVAQLLADLAELVDLTCRRLGHEQVTLFGHSWGSALGVLFAARAPERVAAYVGCGQIGDWAKGEKEFYDFTLAEARRRGHGRALRELEKMGPPPHSVEQLLAARTWLSRFEGRMSPGAIWQVVRAVLGTPEASLWEVPHTMRALHATLAAMWPEVTRLDLNQLAPALAMPVFFLLGRHDHWVPSHVSQAYFEALQAPSKQLVWFEQSGHEPFVDEPEKLNRTMIELVRPVCVERGLSAARRAGRCRPARGLLLPVRR